MIYALWIVKPQPVMVNIVRFAKRTVVLFDPELLKVERLT